MLLVGFSYIKRKKSSSPEDSGVCRNFFSKFLIAENSYQWKRIKRYDNNDVK